MSLQNFLKANGWMVGVFRIFVNCPFNILLNYSQVLSRFILKAFDLPKCFENSNVAMLICLFLVARRFDYFQIDFEKLAGMHLVLFKR